MSRTFLIIFSKFLITKHISNSYMLSNQQSFVNHFFD